MATSSPAIVIAITGRAWIRHSDGSLTELHEGSRIPPDSEVVTASGATVTLQVENGMPVVIGAEREVALNGDMLGPLDDASEAAITPPTGPDSERLLAALEAGGDPFDELDPTAATITGGGGGDGGGSFVRLAHILETTTPLNLAYPNPVRGDDYVPRASGGGGAGSDDDDAAVTLPAGTSPAGTSPATTLPAGTAPGATLPAGTLPATTPPATTPPATDPGTPVNDGGRPPVAVDDRISGTERAVLRGNVLGNDTDADGDTLSVSAVNGRPMGAGGLTLPGSNGGTFTVLPDGTYTFDPGTQFTHLAQGQSAISTVVYTVTDPSGKTSTATLQVTVIGVNDAATISGNTAATAQEDTALTAQGKLSVTDPDAGQSNFVAQAQRAGQYGTFSIDANGNWHYALNNSDPRVQALGVNDKVTDQFTVTSADGTSAQITITINGTNDVPTLSGQATGAVNEDTSLSVSGKLSVSDRDTSDTHTWTVVNGGKGNYGTLTLGADGQWTYNLTNSNPAVQALSVGQTLTETFKVSVDDGHGGIATRDVTITINGTNDAPRLSGDLTGAVTEDGVQSATGQLQTADVDVRDTHTYAVVGNATGTYGAFAVDATGRWTYTLDNAAAQVLRSGQSVQETYTVRVSDGQGAVDTKVITITISGTDDGAVIRPATPGRDQGKVQEDGQLTASGNLDITDPDAGQAVFQAQTGTQGQYGTFKIDANGNWTYSLDNANASVQALGAAQSLTETFTVRAADGATHAVTVTIQGTNDAPTLSGQLTGSVTEDGVQSATGQLQTRDVDTSDTHTYSVVGSATGTYGAFAVDANGKWTYTLDNAAAQVLKAGESVQETYTVRVSDGQGGTDSKVVTVTINGTDDGAVITPNKPGGDAGTVKEDGALLASGKLDVADPDAGQSTFQAQPSTQGQYGNFTIDANGNWTYSLDNTNASVQALGAGKSLAEVFTVRSADGSTSQVTVTIQGTNDAPRLSGALTGAVTEDGVKTATGQLTGTDIDVGDKLSYSVLGAAKGTFGVFAVDANGKWTYTLDNVAAQVLKTGQAVTETYTVQVSDGQGGTDSKVVTITINGTDDGAVITPSKPGDDSGTVKEDGALLASGKLDVADPDAGQSTFQIQTATKGAYGTFAIDANGNWTYNLDNANNAVQALGLGKSLTETFSVKSADGTTSQITVTIQGTNDAPKLSGEVTGSVTEDGVKTASGQLTTSDVDTTDTHTYSVVGNAKGTYGSFGVDATGKWTYTLDNAAAQVLKSGQAVTETYTVQVSDGHGGTDTKVISVTIYGTDDAAVITPHAPGADQGRVQEDGQVVTSGKLDIVDPDAGQAVFQTQPSTQGAFGTFTVDANGNWTYNLDNANKAVQALGADKSLTETFTVTSADGSKHDITVTIQGTNDAPKLSGEVTGSVTEDGTKTASGQLTTTDVDTTDTHTYSVVGKASGTYGSFAIDPTGKWTYTLDNAAAQTLKSGQAITETYTVQVSDGQGGTDTKVISITINGTDDAAVITPHTPGADQGRVQEDGQLVTNGKLDIVDPDAGQAVFQVQPGTQGAYGTFSVDANGNWTYNLDNTNKAVQALGADKSLTETFTVTSADGTKHDITVTIQGTNDAPKLSGEVTGSVTEDGTKIASGQLTTTDVDTTDTHTYSVVGKATGAYGSFAIDATGKWTYTLDNAAAQTLKSGQAITETYTVQVSDGHGGTDTKVISVTINGTDDAAVITPHTPGADQGRVQEDGQLAATGKLDIVDPDAGQALFQAQPSTQGAFGTFTVDANGNWTYNLDNANKAVQALGADKSLTETFTVTSADGSTHDITVTIQGTNDAPKLSGEVTGSVTEDGTKTASGQLTTTDIDATDTHTYSVVGNAKGTYGSFGVDANGTWTYTLDNAAAQTLKSGQAITETYTVQVSDGHGGTDTRVISVTINGTDDAAIITPHAPGADQGRVQEDGQLVTNGKLDIVDPDAGQAVFQPQPGTAGAYGTFAVDANGNWTYNLDNTNKAVQALGADKSLTETFTVTSADGSTHDITVTIQGTNDAPKLSGEVTGSVTEDGVKTATGQLTTTDVDTTDTHTYSVVGNAKGTYGAFGVDATGKWTYTLDNAAAQTLKSGQAITETYTVQVSDGQGGTDTKVISVTINGTDDAAVITPRTPGADQGRVQEDGQLVTNGKLDIVDPDAGQAMFQAQPATAGAYGTFAVDANGNWTYNLDNTNKAVQALGADKSLTETFTVTSADGSKHDITVTIQGTNDAPKLSGEVTGSVTEDGVKTASGQLTASDVDTTDTHTYSVVGKATGAFGSFAVDATGKWTYTLDNAAAQTLKSGQAITETYTVQVSDGHGGTDTKVISVTINGTDDAAIITPHAPGADQGRVQEDGQLTTNGKLDVVDPDAGQAVFQVQPATAGAYGTFAVDANGNWTYNLDNTNKAVQALGADKSLTETFTVTSADGSTHDITVTIQGTNDAPKLSGEVTGSVTEDGVKTASGQLTTSDVDTTDTHTYSVVGKTTGTYGSFAVDASGKWTYTLDNAAAQVLKSGQAVTETYTVQVNDGHGGTDTKVISVTINGTDDAAVITPHTPGADQGRVQEDGQLVTNGKLDIVDPDAGQAVFQAQPSTQGAFGTFTVDANGNWTYNLDNGNKAVQGLGADKSLTETFTVTSADGSTHDITVTIQGSNDAPKLSGEVTGSVTEDGTKTASGQLTTTDVDTTDTHTYSVVGNAKGTYGSFGVDANGKWTYTLDNAAAQTLKSGQAITETYTVQVSDGHRGTDTKVISVTINGTDDAAVITPHTPGADQGRVQEDGQLVTSGKLDIVDPDAGQAVFQAQPGTAGAYGTFAVDANGNWTYNLDNTNKAVQALGSDKSLTETFTVTSADGSKHDITITIQGTNDAPKLSGEVTGSVTEDGVKTASGQLTTTDVDTTDTHTYSVVGNAKGTYGSFGVDANGKWTYTLDNAAAQTLKSGQAITETYTVQVSDGHGGTDTRVISVTINGTDDAAVITPHAPGADQGRVQEDGQLTTNGKLDVVDPDAGQAVFQVQPATAGAYGTFAVDANGNWTYNLDNTNKAVQALGADKSLSETFTVTSADGTKHDITVTIQGTNDAPKLSGEVTGSVTEDGTKTASGQLTTTDVDTTDTHTYSVVGKASGTYGSFAIDPTGKWTYTLDNAAAQTLKSGQAITETYTVQVSDGHGGTDTKVISITINGTDDAAVIIPHTPGADQGRVQEDGQLVAVGKLDIADPDAGQAVFQPQSGTAGAYGTFAVDANGNWTYNLDNGNKAVQGLGADKSLTETFTVTSADGSTHDITVTIQGTNDAPMLSGDVTGSVTEDGTKTASGQLTTTDIDTTDTHTYSVVGNAKGTYGSFGVDANGKWTYTLDNAAAQTLKSGQAITETYTVQVSDGHGGTDTKIISVTINGTDDAAVITPHTPGADQGRVQEDGQLVANGKLDVVDPDAGQAVFQAQPSTQGAYGTFAVDANGTWTYNLDNTNKAVQGLGADKSLTETFTVTSADGSKHDITVTIQGTNDAPKLSGEVTGSVTEDGTKTASGQLTTTDVDTTDTHTYSVVGKASGTYGSFAIDPTGKWTYTLDNAAAQTLKSGQAITETYTVQVSDGQGGTDTKVISVTINGTDDAAVITPHTPGADRGRVQEDGQLVANGKLDVVDPDAGQAVFQAQPSTQGAFGTFTVDANGNWTYNVDNANKAVQALGADKSLTETFTVTSADGSTHDITVTIQGTNDAPKLSGEVTGSLTEDGVKTASGQLTTSDVDTTDTHTYSVVGKTTGTYGSFAVDATGKWTYTLDNAAAQTLKSGQAITETYTVQVSDGHGGTDTKVISVTINGTDDAAVITPHTPGADQGRVQEDGQLVTNGKLDIVDPDAGQAVFQAQPSTQGAFGTFTVDANGNWTYNLDNANKAVQGLGADKSLTETFTVTSADGSTHDITVTIQGTNDAPKLSGEATGSVTEDGVKTASGQLTTTDVDTTDTHTYSVVGNAKGTYGSFGVDANGKWTYTLDNAAAQTLKSGQAITETYTVQVSDGHGGIDTKVISVTINGTDDTAVITPHAPGADQGRVQEDGQLAATGKLDIVDPDSGQAVFQAQPSTQGAFGTFTVDANGNWTYNLDNSNKAVQALGANKSLSEIFTVTSADGSMHDITVTIQGTNDAPKLSGEVTGSVTEDGTKTATGQLTTSDIDTTDTHTYSVVG
ncbi:VCBS domain-containing protein, partial [Bordetella genomosp. 5]|uniref:VCBS domain-containing protein n=1 Tax=Bordetella genomosp. 5 TaxID=1395608 RepID=UPI000B9E6608